MRSFPARRHQRGMTFWQLLFLLFVFGFFGLFGFKTIPVYLDNLSATRDIREVARNGDFNIEDPSTVYRSLERKWDVDYIKYLDFHDIKIVKKASGPELSYDYDVRQHLFYNIDLVMNFQGSVPLGKTVG